MADKCESDWYRVEIWTREELDYRLFVYMRKGPFAYRLGLDMPAYLLWTDGRTI